MLSTVMSQLATYFISDESHLQQQHAEFIVQTFNSASFLCRAAQLLNNASFNQKVSDVIAV